MRALHQATDLPDALLLEGVVAVPSTGCALVRPSKKFTMRLTVLSCFASSEVKLGLNGTVMKPPATSQP